MSDVAQGGATVFPWLGVALQPVKGTAAVWFNLFPSGNGDLRTRHAACPVLQGSKWGIFDMMHESIFYFNYINFFFQCVISGCMKWDKNLEDHVVLKKISMKLLADNFKDP